MAHVLKRRKKKKVKGISEKPRLVVFRGNSNFYAQVIDDTVGYTLCSCSSLEKNLQLRGSVNKNTVRKIAEVLSKKMLEKKISKVVFDRNGYLYHGVIKEFADSCRKNGIEF